jgi:hypothetical protein
MTGLMGAERSVDIYLNYLDELERTIRKPVIVSSNSDNAGA